MPLKTVRIIFAGSGRGLFNDVALLQDILEADGWQTELVEKSRPSALYFFLRDWLDWFKSQLPSWLRNLVLQLQLLCYRFLGMRLKQVFLTIHLENIHAFYIPASNRHWLIPNPEWLRPGAKQYLRFMDRIACKSRDAQVRFESFHSQVCYCGFSGQSAMVMPAQKVRDYGRFLHVAGNSLLKGTQAVVSLWSRHPEWPCLDLVIDDRKRLTVIPGNVMVHECIDNTQLMALRGACGIVLAPSEAEGFGHVLLEGMMSGGIVVTVDAPPMNELIRPDRGYLLPWSRSSQCRLGEAYYVDHLALERASKASLLRTPMCWRASPTMPGSGEQRTMAGSFNGSKIFLTMSCSHHEQPPGRSHKHADGLHYPCYGKPC